MPPRQPTTHYVGQLQAFISTIHTDDSVCSRVFRLTLIHAYLHALPYTAEMAAFFEYVRHSGIHLAMASVGPRQANADDDPVDRVMSATMAMELLPTTPREPRMMVLHGCDHQLFELVSAQLASGTRIDHLVLEDAFKDVFGMERNQPSAKWKLLGHALGEPRCERSPKVLSLAAMMQISEADVNALQVSLQRPREAMVTMVRVSDDAILRYPSGNLSPVRDGSCSFQVAEDDDCDDCSDSEWMKVLTPNGENCFVRCADIVDAFDGVGNVVSKPRLESLDIGCGSCEAPVLVGLTNCFGASLRQLSVHVAFSMTIDDDAWARILRACPQLEAFSLTNVQLQSLDVVCSLFGRGKCAIQRLSLTNTSTEQESVHRFLKMLTDPTKLMTKTIRQLRYLDNDMPSLKSSSNRPSPRALKELTPMLQANQKLEFLEVGLVPKLYKSYELPLRAFHNELLSVGPAGPVYREISLVEITELEDENDDD